MLLFRTGGPVIQVQLPVNRAISDKTRPMTFITASSNNILVPALIKRKAEIYT
jgi:hypothetical protein